VARALVFDVNETLLDLAALRAPFAAAFGDDAPLGEWFARLLHGSLVATVTDSYEDFASIGRRVLETVAMRQRVELSSEQRDAILDAMLRLPAHPEVDGALGRLRSAGFPLGTLSNSSNSTVRTQLEHAGLLDRFDLVLSIEEVRRFKPAPEPYLMAARRLGVAPSELRLVAAHDWDVWGAMRAGCQAAYVARSGEPFTLGRPPPIVAQNLSAVAEEVLRLDEPASER
jgi:2-haloacid dehalogenase